MPFVLQAHMLSPSARALCGVLLRLYRLPLRVLLLWCGFHAECCSSSWYVTSVVSARSAAPSLGRRVVILPLTTQSHLQLNDDYVQRAVETQRCRQ